MGRRQFAREAGRDRQAGKAGFFNNCRGHRRGVKALIYQGLAERSGLSKSAIFYHFHNRDELNRGVSEHVREKYRSARDEADARLPGSPLRELKGWAISAPHNGSHVDAASAKIMMSGLWDSIEGKAHHLERFAAIGARRSRGLRWTVVLTDGGCRFYDCSSAASMKLRIT